MSEFLDRISLENISTIGLALLVTLMIFRGWLIPKPFVDRSDKMYEDRLTDKDDQIEHWRISAEKWRSAFEGSQPVVSELTIQNGKLLGQSEIGVRMLDAVREVQDRTQ